MRTPLPNDAIHSPLVRWTAAFFVVCASALLLHPTSGSAQHRSAGLVATDASRLAPVTAPVLVIHLTAGETVASSAAETPEETSDLGLKDANVAARFLLEVGALGALGYWGFRKGESRRTQIALAVGAPLAAAVVWGTFASPQAPVELAPAARLTLQTAIFGASAAALADAGHPRWALGFAAGVLVNTALLVAWDQ